MNRFFKTLNNAFINIDNINYIEHDKENKKFICHINFTKVILNEDDGFCVLEKLNILNDF